MVKQLLLDTAEHEVRKKKNYGTFVNLNVCCKLCGTSVVIRVWTLYLHG